MWASIWRFSPIGPWACTYIGYSGHKATSYEGGHHITYSGSGLSTEVNFRVALTVRIVYYSVLLTTVESMVQLLWSS